MNAEDFVQHLPDLPADFNQKVEDNKIVIQEDEFENNLQYATVISIAAFVATFFYI